MHDSNLHPLKSPFSVLIPFQLMVKIKIIFVFLNTFFKSTGFLKYMSLNLFGIVATSDQSVSVVEIPRFFMISTITSFAAQITAWHYLLSGNGRRLCSLGMDANSVGHNRSHRYGVTRFTITLVVYTAYRWAHGPFFSSIEMFW